MNCRNRRKSGGWTTKWQWLRRQQEYVRDPVLLSMWMVASGCVWLGGAVVRTLDLQYVRLPASALSGSEPRQVDHTRVPLSPSSIIWYRPMGGDALWLGK